MNQNSPKDVEADFKREIRGGMHSTELPILSNVDFLNELWLLTDTAVDRFLAFAFRLVGAGCLWKRAQQNRQNCRSHVGLPRGFATMPVKSFQPSSLYTSAGRRKYLTPDERRRFLGAANASARSELRTFCLVLAYTGCRISEALALCPNDIEGAGGYLSIRSLKKRSRIAVVREIPVPADVLNALQTIHDLERDTGCRLWPWSRSRAWQLVKAVMAFADIPPGPHATAKGLRHGFGVHAIHSGVPLNLVQRWLGHSRLETTAIYLQAMGKEEREIASRMWG